MQVVAAKAITGEEIFARKEEQTTKSPIIGAQDSFKTQVMYTRVCTMRVVPVGPNQLGLHIAPFMVFKPEIEFTQEQWDQLTLIQYSPPAEAEKQYLDNTSSIQLR